MEQKMINGFPALLAHATPVYHYDGLFLRLSKVKVLPNTAVQTKKATLKYALFLQMLFQAKERLAGG
jgi:hypothetical protein